MLSDLEKPEAPAGRWSWKKTLLVLLLPPVLFFGGILLYDERLEPFDDLKARPMPPVLPAENGYEMLASSWDVDLKRWSNASKRLSETLSGKYLWEESLVIGLNPTGRDLQMELKQALAAKEWRAPEPDLSGGGVRYIQLEAPLVSLKAKVLLEHQKGNDGPTQDLIRDLRRMAGRTLLNPSRWGHIVSGFYISGHAADLTYRVTDKVIEDRVLKEMAGIWDGEDLNRDSLVRIIPGDVAFAGSEFDEELAYGFSQYRRLMTKKNQTRNQVHKHYRLFAKGALMLEPSPEEGLYYQLRRALPSLKRESYLLDPNHGGKIWITKFCGAGPLSLIDSWARKYLFELRAMRVWLALKRWGLAHAGQLPERLEELVPEYLSQVPVNPWEGSPLRWDKADGVIFIWADGAENPPKLNRNEMQYRPAMRTNRRTLESDSNDELMLAVPFTLTPPAVPPVMPPPLTDPAIAKPKPKLKSKPTPAAAAPVGQK